MTRYLTALGLVLAAAVAFTALSTQTAGAVAEETLQAYFIADLESSEIGEIDGEQLGTTTITIGSLPAATCSSVKYGGEAVTEGPISEQVIIAPEYETCHVIAPLLGTRTVTVTMNGCDFGIEATATVTESSEEHLLGGTDIECPAGKKIEIHVYNTSSSNDTGASTLCTFDIEPQTELDGITFTNKFTAPASVNDVVADFNVGSIDVVRKSGTEAFCGAEKQTAVYNGEATLRVTSEASEFVSAEVGGKKHFEFDSADAAIATGEKGSAKFTTEKGPVECTSVKYEASPGVLKPTELSIKPTYASCKFDNLTAHVDFEKCVYKQKLTGDLTPTVKKERHTTGPMEISCGMNESIKIKVTDKAGAVECTMTIGTQTPTGVVDLKNVFGAKTAENYILFTNTLKGIAYEVNGNEATCGKNNVKLTNGELHGAIDVKGFSKGVQIPLQIRGLVAPDCP